MSYNDKGVDSPHDLPSPTYKKTSPKQAMHFKRHAVDLLSV